MSIHQDKPLYNVLLCGSTASRRAAWKTRLAHIGIYRVHAASNAQDNADSAQLVVCIPDDGGDPVILSPEEAALDDQKHLPLAERIALSMTDEYISTILLHVIERARLKRELAVSRGALAEFCHNAAHDLAAPARRIAQFCEILKEESGATLNAESRGYIDRITINALRLQNLVGDILALSQTANPVGEKQLLNPEDILKGVMDDLRDLIAANHATLHTGTLPQIIAYPDAVAKLFKILIENAIKYRGIADPVIEVDGRDENSYVLFTVKDNARGIEKKFHRRIFLPFERLQTRDEVEGAGLGLAICEKIVALHGGKIWLEDSSPENGSVFQFTLQKS